MAYVCKQEFGKKNKAGKGIRFDSKVHVLANGEFVFYDLPDEILQLLTKAEKGVRTRRGKTGLFVARLDEGIYAIEEAIELVLKTEITNEYVIRYNYTATCHYYIAEDGTLHQNGVDIDRGKWSVPIQDGEDYSSSHFNRCDYTVGFRAEVTRKIFYKSGKHTSIEYEYVGEDCEEVGEWAHKLNTFVSVGMFGEPIEIPYTEVAAKIFYESMWRLCCLSHQLSEFLKEPKNILSGANMPRLIEGGQ